MPRVGMKPSFDHLTSNMRAVIVAGINVVHAGGDSRPQHIHRSIHVARRAPNPAAGQLHGAVAHSVNSARGSGKGELAAELSLYSHFVFSSHLQVRSGKMETVSEYLDYRRQSPVASFF